MATITAANSVFTIAVPNLYSTARKIEGFAVDDAFTASAVERAETVMGVDGKLSSGYIFNYIEMTVTIMPDSPSLSFFENWDAAQLAAKEVYNGANGVISLPAIKRKYTLKNGVLKTSQPFPSVKKTLQPVSFTVVWESITGEDS